MESINHTVLFDYKYGSRIYASPNKINPFFVFDI